VSISLRGLHFAHGEDLESLVDMERRGRIANGQAFRMFGHVDDPLPGVVVQRFPLGLRHWRRDGVG
jgi:hypothetical protein